MRLPIYQVDAFAERPFGGNPAAVVVVKDPLDAGTMQAIAEENNLSETAFLERGPAGWRIRWFTPACEVDLCGHATLASAWVVFHRLEPAAAHVEFQSASGPLRVARREDGLLELDFPSRPAVRCQPPDDLVKGLGAGAGAEFLMARDFMAVFPREVDVRNLRPDFATLARVDVTGIIATAPGEFCDFVSRFFAPASGIDEDPVTGSAHCTLIPYWAARLSKTRLDARQISKRGGALRCELRGDRVGIAGRCRPFLEGTIEI
ncbi:MAG: PhzF family phenazine biosynthesis protein [Planctomycetia bacterium]|nr:PhzF family phenazine biosynthesis protein [Planctomycetia bacterium]